MCPISYAQPVTHQITWVENGALVNETLGHTPHCGQRRRHPSLVRTHENPGAKLPRRAATCQRAATEVAGTAHAATMMPTVRRKSSTGRRVRPHTPTNSTSTTRPTTHPQQPETGSDSALRTTPDAPMIGAHPPIPCPGHTPHCGHHQIHQPLALTYESPGCNSALRTTAPAPTMGAHPRTT